MTTRLERSGTLWYESGWKWQRGKSAQVTSPWYESLQDKKIAMGGAGHDNHSVMGWGVCEKWKSAPPSAYKISPYRTYSDKCAAVRADVWVPWSVKQKW